MIIPAHILVDTLPAADEKELLRKGLAVEAAIRAYTNNNFQNRDVRAWGYTVEGIRGGIMVELEHVKLGDNIQLSESVNNGVYTIADFAPNDVIVVNAELYTEQTCLVTRVDYPADVQEGALNLIKWDMENRDKVGVKSESLSRKSTTYYDMDATNSLMGYPASLIGFLKPYIKARF